MLSVAYLGPVVAYLRTAQVDHGAKDPAHSVVAGQEPFLSLLSLLFIDLEE